MHIKYHKLFGATITDNSDLINYARRYVAVRSFVTGFAVLFTGRKICQLAVYLGYTGVRRDIWCHTNVIAAANVSGFVQVSFAFCQRCFCWSILETRCCILVLLPRSRPALDVQTDIPNPNILSHYKTPY